MSDLIERSACLIFLLSFGFLTGCSPSLDSQEGLFSDYSDRLTRVMDLEPADNLTAAKWIPYPSVRELAISTAEIKIGFLDFFSIMDCDLNRLVGHRNSSLGKVMLASQRWLYEQQFLASAERCLSRLEANDRSIDLQRQLREVLSVKRSDIDNVAWNAIWAGPEFQMQMKHGGATLATDFVAADWSELTGAFTQVTQWSSRPEEAVLSSDLEQVNQVLVVYPLYGQLVLSLEQSIVGLNYLNAGMQKRLAHRPICINKKANEKARILRNVLLNIFVPGVQAYLAELTRAGQIWRAQLQASADALKTQRSEGFKRFYKRYIKEGAGSVWFEVKQATVSHAMIWEKIFSQCGMRVGN